MSTLSYLKVRQTTNHLFIASTLSYLKLMKKPGSQGGRPVGRVAWPTTPNLPTKIMPAKIPRLIISWKSPMDMNIPTLTFKILLESNSLKSRILFEMHIRHILQALSYCLISTLNYTSAIFSKLSVVVLFQCRNCHPQYLQALSFLVFNFSVEINICNILAA